MNRRLGMADEKVTFEARLAKAEVHHLSAEFSIGGKYAGSLYGEAIEPLIRRVCVGETVTITIERKGQGNG